MAKTALDIQWTAAATGKKATTKVNYVNPEADSNELQDLAQSLNSLTTNTYVEANRIDTINVDTEQPVQGSRNVEISTTQANQICSLSYNISEGSTINPAVMNYQNNQMLLITTSNQTLITPTRAQRTFTVPSAGEIYIGFSEKADFFAFFEGYSIT